MVDKSQEEVINMKTLIIHEVSNAMQARQSMGVSQLEFAKKLGVSVRTYQEWEQGRRTPTGAAKTLLTLIIKKPELISEI